MLLAQRLEKIKHLLLEKRSIDNSELSQLLGVSEVTIRKDLIRLEEQGFLQKIHGGAVLKDTQEIAELSKISNFSAKMDLAKMALDLIEDGDSLFIGGGTTCRIFAHLLKKKKKNLRVVTNDFLIALELKDSIKNIFFLGGQIESDEDTLYTTGMEDSEFLNNLYVNHSFITVDGLDFQAGLTLNSYFTLRLINEVKRKTKNLTLLVDSSKFDRVAVHVLGSLNFSNCLVTDRKISSKYKEYFFKNNIKLISALDY